MSVIKDGVVCCDPDCWVNCSWAFEGMCHLHMLCSMSLENSGCTYLACRIYEGDSNENLKSAIKIWNTARLFCKLTTVLLVG
jgi:hypothetical protein